MIVGYLYYGNFLCLDCVKHKGIDTEKKSKNLEPCKSLSGYIDNLCSECNIDMSAQQIFSNQHLSEFLDDGYSDAYFNLFID